MMSNKQVKSSTPPQPTMELAIVNPHAAGMDIGSKFHVSAVGQRNEELLQTGVTTPDLHELAQEFKRRGIRTVAMESTGYFWIPVAMLLRDYGFEVIVVNGASVKGINRPKTDHKDARWIQKLHSLGMLKPSFQLDNFNEGLRTYSRRRRTLVQDRTRLLNRMHKALVLMNVQIGMFLTELDSKSGMDIITAIVKGERDPKKLYAHVRPGVKTPKEQMLKALEGTWQAQHLFELKQLHNAYEFCMLQIKECDVEIERQIEAYCKENGIEPTPPESKPPSDKRSAFYDNHAPKFNSVDNLQRIVGADFLAIDGIGPNFILDIVTELGFTLEQFPTGKHFTSWLSLSPQNKVTGGKTVSSKIPKRNNRAAQAFRQAANSIGNTKNHPLRPFFLNILKKQGRKGAIVATARKLATIVYRMVKDNTAFDYQISETDKNRQRNNLLKKFQKAILEFQFSKEELNFAA
jgi:transposase